MDNVEQQLEQEELRNKLSNFIVSRQNLVCFLYKAATELDEHHKNVKIIKVVTGSTGIAGTLISLAGLAFAIPTGGFSLALTIGGSVLAATSGAAHLGSGVVEHFLDQSYMDDLDKLSRADEENYFRLNDYLPRYVEELRNNVFNNNVSDETKLDIFKEISSLAGVGCSIVRVTRIASTAARSIRVFATASAVLGVVTLPLQIIDLARDGHALNKNQRSEKAQEFRQLAQNLTTQVDNVTQRMEEIINWHEQQQNHQDNQQIITFNPVTAIFSPFFLIIIFLIIIKNVISWIFSFFN